MSSFLYFPVYFLKQIYGILYLTNDYSSTKSNIKNIKKKKIAKKKNKIIELVNLITDYCISYHSKFFYAFHDSKKIYVEKTIGKLEKEVDYLDLLINEYKKNIDSQREINSKLLRLKESEVTRSENLTKQTDIFT